MKTRETTTPVRAFDRAYINGQFVTPHGTQIVDLVNPTDNKVIGKVTMADNGVNAKSRHSENSFHRLDAGRKTGRQELPGHHGTLDAGTRGQVAQHHPAR